jgi:predicted outer membrane repeat protein
VIAAAVAAAAGILVAGAALVATASAASAAGAGVVDCSTTNLQTAIDSASSGAKLAVTGTCFGSFTIDKDLTLLGQGTAVLDGQHAVTPLIILSGATVRLAHLTITDGLASYPPPTIHCGFCVYGGGIYNAGTLSLNESAVTVNNSGGGAAGGIFNAPSAVLTIIDTTVSGNGALYGGGIYNGGGTMTLERSSVTENSPGGIANTGYLTVKDSTISDNQHGVNGGGISNSGYVTLKDTTVTGNGALNGGGIYNAVSGVSGTMTLKDTTVSGNSAASAGGGIYNLQGDGTVSVKNSTVSGNTPDDCAANYPPIQTPCSQL